MNSQAPRYEMDQEEMKYWARRGSKTAAFLLVIPGATLVGVGYGLLVNQLPPYSAMGLGAGLLIWGMIVSLTN